MGITAIFGGTFNPIHIGHFEMLDALEKCENIEKILILPDKVPPHKVCDFMASDEDRIKMCEIAVKKFSKAELCLLEFKREGKSYSFDTVTFLKEMYPNKKFAFVCGGDMLITLDKWYRADELLKMVPFIAFRRLDIDDTVFDEKCQYLRSLGADITIFDERITNVSSTEIRADISKAKHLLDSDVYEFVVEKGIYNNA